MNLLDRLLREFPRAKRQTLKRMVQNGRVTINGSAAVALKQAVTADDRVVVISETGFEPALSFPIVFEDGDILVVNKPAGLLTSTVPREPRPTALAAVREYLSRDRSVRVGLVHRLDRDASGLLVFSKNQRAFASLKRQFFRHTVTRIYRAIVMPPPQAAKGRIESSLVERADGTVHSTRAANRGQRALTDFVVEKADREMALLRVILHTGRKHQIRAHLSESGSPIVGDRVYGAKPNDAGLMLAAVELALDHPRTDRRMSWRIEITGAMAKLASRIGVDI
jgi:23S rRNA pseudouridine1911/1915/1917 synthase